MGMPVVTALPAFTMSLPNERSNWIESFANIVFVTCASFQASYEGFEGNVRRNWIFRQLFAELAGKMLIWAILAPRNADKLALGGSPFHPLPLLPMLSLQKKVIADGCFYLTFLVGWKKNEGRKRRCCIFMKDKKNFDPKIKLVKTPLELFHNSTLMHSSML